MEDFDPQQLALDPTLAVAAKPQDKNWDRDRASTPAGETPRESATGNGVESEDIPARGGEGREGA